MNMMWIAMATGLVIAGQQDSSEGVRAAVVDVPRVSEQYRKTTDLETHFGKIRDTFTKERDAKRDKIQRLTRSLQEELKPGSEDFRQRAKQIAMLEADLAWFNESEGERIERGLRTSLLSIYTDIHTAVREVARERKVDLVLTADRLPEDPPGSVGQVRQQILLQKVLFWSPRLDITDAVVERLNATYERETKRAGTTGGGSTPSAAGGGSQRAPAPSDLSRVP